MKTETELLHLALVASGDVTTVQARFNQTGTIFTYLCARDVARTLEKGDHIVVQRGPRNDRLGTRLTVALVHKIHKEPHLDDSFEHSWVLRHLDDEMDALVQIFEWTDELTELMSDAQRRKTREAILGEFGTLPALRSVPTALASPSDEVIDLEDEGSTEDKG